MYRLTHPAEHLGDGVGDTTDTTHLTALVDSAVERLASGTDLSLGFYLRCPME